jgi:hypothetical protein
MARQLPVLAVMLGVAGIIPFVVCGLWAVSASYFGSLIAVQLLVAYGAVVLSFVGGIHRGVSLVTDDGDDKRLALGVLPGLAAWLVLALSVYLARPSLGVALVAVLFVVAAAAEWNGRLRGGIPRGFILLRIGVTGVIVAILSTVLLLRLIGGHLLL